MLEELLKSNMLKKLEQICIGWDIIINLFTCWLFLLEDERYLVDVYIVNKNEEEFYGTVELLEYFWYML